MPRALRYPRATEAGENNKCQHTPERRTPHAGIDPNEFSRTPTSGVPVARDAPVGPAKNSALASTDATVVITAACGSEKYVSCQTPVDIQNAKVRNRVAVIKATCCQATGEG